MSCRTSKNKKYSYCHYTISSILTGIDSQRGGSKLNYPREINLFYDWLETNTLTDSAIVLWHALMHTSNKAGWPDEFAVAVSTLSIKTGLKKGAIGVARNRLQQVGRISFVSRTGQLSAVYRLIPFEVIKSTQTDAQNDSGHLMDTNQSTNMAQSDPQTWHKPVPLIRSKDLSSRSTTTTTTREKPEPQSVTEAYASVFGGGTMPDIFARFLVPLMKSAGEKYVVELILESGESGTKPSLRHIEAIHEAWVKRGVKSRKEAKPKGEVILIDGHGTSPQRGGGEYDGLSM